MTDGADMGTGAGTGPGSPGTGAGSAARATADREALERLYRPRLTGKPGRLEVWYATLTDPRTGTGVWIHHEVLAPADGGPARPHGWISVFPADGRPPVTERFGPESPGATLPVADSPVPYYTSPEVHASSSLLAGAAGGIRWRLRVVEGGGAPLYTFPRWAWRTRLLPAAQIVPAPDARFYGEVDVHGEKLELADARGGVSRIAGHGNAKRWAWLHAGLGGGDVLEIVAAVARRPGMRLLPPLPLLRLRVGGKDWPRDPLLAAPRFTADIGLPEWTVTGRAGRRRLRVEVRQDPADCVALSYTDPDGATATCTNSERASAEVVTERRRGSRWETEHRWSLDHTAHAEVGKRP
ncbi:hypothetical protein [Streptomyces xinghaiensis]|uniref:hypothetical protein n=1 Tax=Streptomyces xinghaiensis TaxID=1038928 RepID=UPI003438C846